MNLNAGDTFVGDPSALDTTGGKHLWVVLHRYRADDGVERIILINFTSVTKRGWTDESCVVKPGDPGVHSFIKKPSFALYEEAREFEVGDIDLTKCEQRERVSPTLVHKLQKGWHNSKGTPKELRSLVPRPPGT